MCVGESVCECECARGYLDECMGVGVCGWVSISVSISYDLPEANHTPVSLTKCRSTLITFDDD